MLCAGCDLMHSYADAITMCHKVDAKWKKRLVDYCVERDGIPDEMGFLAGEAYLATQEAKKKGSRKTRTSMQAATSSNDGDVTRNARKKLVKKEVVLMSNQDNCQGGRE